MKRTDLTRRTFATLSRPHDALPLWPQAPRPLFSALLLTGLLALPAHADESSAADWLRNPSIGNYRAYAEFKMANYAAARQIWQTLAGTGNTEALFNLGILAEDGLGEKPDIDKAVALYTAAAEAGGFKAQYRLGMLYSSGGAVPRDLAKARRYLAQAAAAGDSDAAARLQALDAPDQRAPTPFERAEIHASRGEHEAAAALYQLLAATGDAKARTRLAWMYEAGRGVTRDLNEAARLFLASAQAGDAEAQYAIGVMTMTGRGQALDPESAREWLRKAAAQNHPAARAALAGDTDAR